MEAIPSAGGPPTSSRRYGAPAGGQGEAVATAASREPLPPSRAVEPGGSRVLVLSAPVGESHGAMARALAAGLRAADPAGHVDVVNDFATLGPVLRRVLDRGFRFHLDRVGWSYDLAYRLFTGLPPARAAGEAALRALGGRSLRRLVEEVDPDVVVSTYPVMNPVLAGLRRRGRLEIPVCALVGPLAGHEFWAQRGIDLHLAVHPEAVPAIERLAGPGTTRVVRPPVDPAFYEPRSSREARLALGLSAAPVIVVCGGGWGAGDLEGATEVALGVEAAQVVTVAGRNDHKRERLERRFAGEPRVRVLGFTDRMSDLLAAADALVTATAGTSVLEARLRGCPAVCYGFFIGHVRENTAAMAELGHVRRASEREELAGALRAALAGGRRPAPDLEGLPSAAELTLELAGGRPADRAGGRALAGARAID